MIVSASGAERHLGPFFLVDKEGQSDEDGCYNKPKKLDRLVGERLLAQSFQGAGPEVHDRISGTQLVVDTAVHDVGIRLLIVAERQAALVQKTVLVQSVQTSQRAALSPHGDGPRDATRQEEQGSQSVGDHGNNAGDFFNPKSYHTQESDNHAGNKRG